MALLEFRQQRGEPRSATPLTRSMADVEIRNALSAELIASLSITCDCTGADLQRMLNKVALKPPVCVKALLHTGKVVSNDALIMRDFCSRGACVFNAVVGDVDIIRLKEFWTASEVKSAGYTLEALKRAGYAVKEARSAGCTVKELREAGYPFNAEFLEAGYSAADFREQGITVLNEFIKQVILTERRGGNFFVLERYDHPHFFRRVKEGKGPIAFRSHGESARTVSRLPSWLLDAGFTVAELCEGGITVAELRAAGITVAELLAAGEVLS